MFGVNTYMLVRNDCCNVCNIDRFLDFDLVASPLTDSQSLIHEICSLVSVDRMLSITKRFSSSNEFQVDEFLRMHANQKDLNIADDEVLLT